MLVGTQSKRAVLGSYCSRRNMYLQIVDQDYWARKESAIASNLSRSPYPLT